MAAEKKEYRVAYHQVARTSMRAALGELLKAGWQKNELERLASALEDRLRKDPHSFGEPHYSIKAINLNVSVGFVRPLSVQIGIHEETRVVFIRKVTLMTTEKD